MILTDKTFRHHIEFFNAVDSESIQNAISNDQCWEWMCQNIPRFECPDRDIEQIYYYRWWVLRKHLKTVNSWEFSTMPAERNVRELYGYLPWKFQLPEPGYESAWLQLLNDQGFAAPYGPTTAEQRHPCFMKYRVKRCQWDGPSWPFTTSMTLGALERLLHEYKQDLIGKQAFFDLLKTYARSQHRTLPYGDEILSRLYPKVFGTGFALTAFSMAIRV